MLTNGLPVALAYFRHHDKWMNKGLLTDVVGYMSLARSALRRGYRPIDALKSSCFSFVAFERLVVQSAMLPGQWGGRWRQLLPRPIVIRSDHNPQRSVKRRNRRL